MNLGDNMNIYVKGMDYTLNLVYSIKFQMIFLIKSYILDAISNFS